MDSTSEKTDTKFFYEDLVYRHAKRGHLQLGIVVDNSELASSDEESSDEEKKRPQKGTLRVSWYPSGKEQVIKESIVGLADRSLMPGDVIRRLIKGKETQRGYCRHVNVRCACLIVGTDQVICGLKTENLNRINRFTPDVAVCLNEWVGIIRHVTSKLTIRFLESATHVSNAKNEACKSTEISRCILSDIDAEELEDALDENYEGFNDFYEGQILTGPLNIFEHAEFLSCSDKLTSFRKNSRNRRKKMRVIVEKVMVEGLEIEWKCRGISLKSNSNNPEELKQPDDYIIGDDLERVRMLNVFSHCSVEVGDRYFYTLQEGDTILHYDDWKKLEKSIILENKSFDMDYDKNSPPKKLKSDNNVEGTCNAYQLKCHDEILNTTNVADTTECDKTVQTVDISKIELPEDAPDAPVKKVKDVSGAVTQAAKKRQRKKIKAKKIVSKEFNDVPSKCLAPKLEINPGNKLAVEIISTRREVTVVWQDGTIETNVPSNVLFPILHLDDQEFFCGDYVVRSSNKPGNDMLDANQYGVIQNVNHFDRISKVHWYQTYTSESNESKPSYIGETEEPVFDLKDHPDFKYRPGSIIMRVANFSDGTNLSKENNSGNEFSNGTGGQVIDNFPSGKILIWWPNNESTECWPQDLYKIGEYDSDEGELWDDGDETDGSWETESVKSEDSWSECLELVNVEGEAEEMVKAKLAKNIEKTRMTLDRLADLFHGNQAAQITSSLKDLLDVHKGCRVLDILTDSTFFEDTNFDGLVEKIREFLKYPHLGHQQALKEQMSRLFTLPSNNESYASLNKGQVNKIAKNTVNIKKTEKQLDKNIETGKSSSSVQSCEQNSETSCTEKIRVDASKNENCDNRDTLQLDENLSKIGSNFCSLLKTQLLKSLEEVTKKYGGQATAFTQEDLKQTPGEEQAELDEIMSQVPIKTPRSERRNCKIETPKTPKRLSQVSDYEITTALHGTPEQKKQEHESKAKLNCEDIGEFSMAELAPNEHKFKLAVFQPNDPKNFIKFVRKELQLLKSSLPSGIFVKGFEDRMDLYSVMIKGPEKTPYEDGLFFFDFQLPSDYPKVPPLVHYISYVADKLNPNLYEDGKVCVSLLGTWSGKGTETWTPNSNMLQLLVSIQGLILVPEPYYNEAGYERQKGTQQGIENSRMYNELAILKMTQSLSLIAKNPLHVFKEEILDHLKSKSDGYINRLEAWLSYSESKMKSNAAEKTIDGQGEQLTSSTVYETTIPEFPLLPGSKGFCISLRKALAAFRETMNEV